MSNKSYTERQYRCNDCGKMFLNSQLVKRRVETGNSSPGKKYYNDRLVCRFCATIRDIR